jgi:hypothetical protein
MYNTYTGNGFQLQTKAPADTAASRPNAEILSHISASTKDTIVSAKIPPAPGSIPSAANPQPITAPTAVKVIPANGKDSLLAARKAFKDSLAAARKARKDSIATARRQAYSADSLARVYRKAGRDSLLAMKKPPSTDSGVKSGAASAQLSTTVSRQPSTNAPPTLNPQPSAALPSTVNHRPSTIKKLREVSLKVSRKIVYLDKGGDGTADTITLFVYFETGDYAGGKSAPAQVPAVKKTGVADTTVANKALTAAKNGETGCSQVATDADLEFLRSAILKGNTEQEKISVATGAFSMKCFTVSQVRMLASLLVSDKAKYRLMDAAYPHIADRDHFRELADMYTDKNFQRKFLVLADKRS